MKGRNAAEKAGLEVGSLSRGQGRGPTASTFGGPGPHHTPEVRREWVFLEDGAWPLSRETTYPIALAPGAEAQPGHQPRHADTAPGLLLGAAVSTLLRLRVL